MWAMRARKAAAGILFIAGFLWFLFSLAVTFLRYGLPPCESDEPVFWAMGGCAAGLIAGGGIMLVPRLRALTRAVLAVGIPTATFAVLYVVFADNVARQAACTKRTLPQAMAACGAVASHYRSGIGAYGYPTLTLVAPGTTDGAWSCLGDWARHADGAPSLLVDESVYPPRSAKPEAAKRTPAP